MADKKISALTAATTPLAGTEVLPIVQSGATVKVAVSDLTAGRAIAASAATITGATTAVSLTLANTGGGTNATFAVTENTGVTLNLNEGATARQLIIQQGGTEVWRLNASGNLAAADGKGIDFSATSGTGTSELFADYEEGTFTPAYQTSNSDITYSAGTNVNGKYTKVGNTVFFSLMIRGNITGGTGDLRITGLPFAAVTVNSAGCPCSISANFEWTSSPGTNPTVAGTLIVLGSIGATNFAATAIGASKSGSGSYNEVTLSGTYQTS